MSRVTCHVSRVTGHVSCVTIFFLFLFGLSGWDCLVEGLLSTGLTPSSFPIYFAVFVGFLLCMFKPFWINKLPLELELEQELELEGIALLIADPSPLLFSTTDTNAPTKSLSTLYCWAYTQKKKLHHWAKSTYCIPPLYMIIFFEPIIGL